MASAALDIGVAWRGKSENVYEDAHFIAGRVAGLADGVSGWKRYGIDAGRFAREFMSHCQALFLTGGRELCDEAGLYTAAEEAMRRTQSFGSCTVLIAYVGESRMNVLSLGDSQAAVIRCVDGELCLAYKSEPLLHSWNTPYQLAKIPPNLNRPFINDKISDSLHFSFDVNPGDWVVMGTDGVWNNLFDWEIAQILENGYSSKGAAEAITRRAQEKSVSTEATPYGEGCSRDEEGVVVLGGKPDDITTVVAKIDLL